ncbi:hypothetical protein BS47DRAFT_1077824 [Hydnum rufescens UP504]|uniref:Uncharacterized protein n=1 Tax=Hydnum rufescens UP504 TaxID=1448309 RepID=A0A9P6E252_9AGAM|nr:hypothetical protein BS47DRAFT_1077824 [Hydnum rufescens UP504]
MPMYLSVVHQRLRLKISASIRKLVWRARLLSFFLHLARVVTPKAVWPVQENELSPNEPEFPAGGGGKGGMRRPSSTPQQLQRHRQIQGHPQGEGQNDGRSLEYRSSSAQAYLLPTAPDTPLAKLNMTGQMGDPRPSYKRLPSQVLGPVDVKRTAFDLSAMPDGDEEALDGDDEDGEDDSQRDIRLQDHDRKWMVASENRNHVSSARPHVHRRSMSSPSSTRPTAINAFAAFPGLGPDFSSRYFIRDSTSSPFAPTAGGRVASTTTTAAS